MDEVDGRGGADGRVQQLPVLVAEDDRVVELRVQLGCGMVAVLVQQLGHALQVHQLLVLCVSGHRRHAGAAQHRQLVCGVRQAACRSQRLGHSRLQRAGDVVRQAYAPELDAVVERRYEARADELADDGRLHRSGVESDCGEACGHITSLVELALDVGGPLEVVGQREAEVVVAVRYPHRSRRRK